MPIFITQVNTSRGSLFHLLQQEAAVSARGAGAFDVSNLKTRLIFARGRDARLARLWRDSPRRQVRQRARRCRQPSQDRWLRPEFLHTRHTRTSRGLLAACLRLWAKSRSFDHRLTCVELRSRDVELFTGLMPWERREFIIQIIRAVAVQGTRLTVPAMAKNVPGSVCKMINSCFGSADGRPTFETLFNFLRELLVQLNLQSIPDSLLFLIILELMLDPVICSDGHSYKRASIEQ